MLTLAGHLLCIAPALAVGTSTQVELEFEFAESAHEIDCPAPLRPPCNFMQQFIVEDQCVVGDNGFAWDFTVQTNPPSLASEIRIDVTAPSGFTVTFAGDADFDLPEQGGQYNSVGASSAFDGELAAGTWAFLFYESIDDALNGADAIYSPGMTFSLSIVEGAGGDLNCDLVVDVFDLLELLNDWGGDGPAACLAPPLHVVDVSDLLELLALWPATS